MKKRTCIDKTPHPAHRWHRWHQLDTHATAYTCPGRIQLRCPHCHRPEVEHTGPCPHDPRAQTPLDAFDAMHS